MKYQSFLIKYAEIGTKGKNRFMFEDALIKQIRYALKSVEGRFEVTKESGRIYVMAEGDYDYDDVIEALKRVFGIADICPMVQIEDKDYENLKKRVVEYMDQVYPDKHITFKVNARRGDKNYPVSSDQINRDLGVTIIIITHEMAVIKEICNRAAVMEHGEVIEQGDVYSLFATPQSPVTQGFINTSSLAQKVEELDREGSPVVALKPGEQILQLTYLGMGASQALISEVSRKFSINCNIVFGSIEIIQESPLGRLIIIASGREGDIAQAIAYLRQQKVEVEVLKQCQK